MTTRKPLIACVVLSCSLGWTSGASAHSTTSITGIDARYPDVTLYIPDAYDPATPSPLLIVLHGYSGTGQDTENYLQFLTRLEEYGYLYAYPTGREDLSGNPFWTANDHCCNLDDLGDPDDDLNYLTALLLAIKSKYNVAQRQVFVVGHSNGGMMAHRLACDRAGEVAAIVSLAGPSYYDETLCATDEPAHVVHIHGTADEVVSFAGGVHGPNGLSYPSATEVVQDWVAENACSTTAEITAPMDLDIALDGPETRRYRYASGCNFGGSAEFWQINGGSHVPALGENFRTQVLNFLFAHPNHRIWFDDDSTMGWDTVAVANSSTKAFNVYRGTLADLVDGDDDGLPDVVPAYGDCVNSLDTDLTDEIFVDTTVPSAASGFFYLVDYVDDAQTLEGGIGKTREPGRRLQRPIEAPCP